MFTRSIQEYMESIKNKKIEITLLSALAIITSAVPMLAFAEEGRADNNKEGAVVGSRNGGW